MPTPFPGMDPYYDLAIDYSQPADPPLEDDDALWAAQVIGQREGERSQ